MIRRHATWMLIHPRSATFVSGLCFNFGEVFDVAYDTLLRTLLGAFRACPAPRRERRSRGDRPTVFGHAGRVTLPFFRGSALLPWVIRPARRAGPTIFGHAGRVTLPRFRAGGGYSVPLFAAQSRHEEPYPPISKINHTFPFILPFTGSAEKYTPFPRRFQAGNAFFWKLRVAARPGGLAPPVAAYGGRRGLTRDENGDKQTLDDKAMRFCQRLIV